jgi:hypothetical protein
MLLPHARLTCVLVAAVIGGQGSAAVAAATAGTVHNPLYIVMLPHAGLTCDIMESLTGGQSSATVAAATAGTL